MLLPALRILLLVAAVIIGLGLLGVMALGVQRFFVRYIRPAIPEWVQPGAEHHHCRYCRLGRAYVHDESARLEGDDLVEVRCFVCLSCGLPQWTVLRTAVLKKAA